MKIFMMTPHKLGPASLRRWYRVWFFGGILFSAACVYNLFFTTHERDDLAYVSLLVPAWWFGCAAYCTRRLRYLAQNPPKDAKK